MRLFMMLKYIGENLCVLSASAAKEDTKAAAEALRAQSCGLIAISKWRVENYNPFFTSSKKAFTFSSDFTISTLSNVSFLFFFSFSRAPCSV